MATTQQQSFNEFTLPVDGYAAFDALSLKSLIINRLNASNIITDQNFEGSNLSSIIDIVAYAYHVLLFYLNRTGAESTFTTAELYENVNKIVKLIGYRPIGAQTSILSFQAKATAALTADTYTVPRYSYFTVNGTRQSFTKDCTFTKNTNVVEPLIDFQTNNLLYQGQFVEYPTYVANGSPFELVTITVASPTDKVIIDHFNTDVYVRDNTQTTPKWVKWSSTQSLFLERSTATVYEIRLNENSRYEIKFGNNITGKQLNAGDEVAIYYLQSDGLTGQLGPKTLDGNKLFLYQTQRFNAIQTDTTPVNLQLLTATQASALVFGNTSASTPFVDIESVDNIKNNAGNSFKSQYRLITATDFITYISSNYSNIITSVQAVNNWDYMQGHLKYYFDLGVTAPNNESRVLFNQVKFADSTNFNNVYIYAVPRIEKTNSLSTRVNYLNSMQKQLIINDLQATKLTTTEIIINDPVYMEVDLGVQISNNNLDPSFITSSTKLVVTTNSTAKNSAQSIAQQIAAIFSKYFSTTNNNLGLLISVSDITNSVLQVNGVTKIETVTTAVDGSTYKSPGISLIVYNPVYPYNDVKITNQDMQLPYFKFPYLNNASTFINKIAVISSPGQNLNV